MKYIKPILATLLLLTAILCGYIYYHFDEKYAENNALAAFRENDLQKVRSSIALLSKKNHGTFHQYQGYLALEEGSFDKAAESFKQAITLTKNKETLLELHGALMLTYWLSNNDEPLNSLLETPSTYDQLSNLFSALCHYKNSNYLQAEEKFALAKTSPPSYMLERELGHFLPKSKQSYYLAHAMIENKRIEKARKLIDSLPYSEDPSFYYLVGLSYIKEAEDKSESSAIPYYQTAFENFRQIPLKSKDYTDYKESIISHYKKLITLLLHTSSYSELGLFLDILSYLDARVNEVADLFVTHIQKEIEQDDKVNRLQLARQTLAYCHNSSFKEKLSESLYFYIQNLIKDRKGASLKKAWPIYNQILPDCEEDRLSFSKVACDELKKELSSPDFDLETAGELLELVGLFNFSDSDKSTVLDQLYPSIKKIFSLRPESALLFSQALDQHLSLEESPLMQEKMDDFYKEIQKQMDPQKEVFEEPSIIDQPHDHTV